MFDSWIICEIGTLKILEIEPSEEEDAVSENKRVSANLAEWNDRLLPVQINDFSGINPGPTTNIDKLTRKKEKSNFFHLLFSEKMYTDIANETNPYA
jgi:hypothetical protein